MIDGSEKRNRQLAFELQNAHVCEKRSKINRDDLRCFDTVFRRPYRYFSIALKGSLSSSYRYKTSASD